ncbi:hypothetical protein JW964_16080 [candidate division KSB1 bacterium]|nr:hypothetical protein [candidate division KSB1 bacterium]
MRRLRNNPFSTGLLILIFGVLSNVFSQSGNITLENKLDKSTVRIGDIVTYTLQVVHDESTEVVLPGRAFVMLDSAMHLLPDDALNIRDYHKYDPQEKDGKIVEGVEYIFAPFLVGKFIIAPLTVTYRTKSDSTLQRLNTEPIQLTVESLKPSETGDIRDIKTQWEIERNWWLLWSWIILAAGSLLLLAVIIYVIIRLRSGKGILSAFEKPSRPPHEIALERLNELLNSNWLAEGRVKEFYIEISNIIRHYIEGRYFIEALEMTTSQLVRNLEEAKIEKENIDLINNFLSACDLVKFAKYIPSDAETQQVIELAREIIMRTQIILEPTPAEAEQINAEAAYKVDESAPAKLPEQTENMVETK